MAKEEILILPKPDLAAALFLEIDAAQERPIKKGRSSPFPPMLWVGDGRAIKASDEAFELVWQYAHSIASENSGLTSALMLSEVADIIGKAAAVFVAEFGLRDLVSRSADWLVTELDNRIQAFMSAKRGNAEYYFGCTLLHGVNVPAITIGPVSFRSNEEWLNILVQERNLPEITARRMRLNWSGKKPRPRKAGRDYVERSLLDAVGRAPVVATVMTRNQSSKTAEPKALLSARIAMTAISLIWRKPSVILDDMRLNHDGGFDQRHYAVCSGPGSFGSSHSSFGSPKGFYVGEDEIHVLTQFMPILDQVGAVLDIFVDPERKTDRPKILKTIFMSLWWFHEACRERSDLIAIAKFASSLDSLASGKRADGIKRLIVNRLGRDAKRPWFKDGRSSDDVIREIYEITRNQVIHGSIKTFDQDWSAARNTAQFVARECLVASLEWIHNNQNSNVPGDLLK